ncbi:MAG: DNA repair exonuclease [Candidatus Bipolaricaulota bacterium]|nr:DNA repair exonuclease [Candidatus Bipolaricaulota bacterium]MCS7274716.1 DNA repair exonuclease [Candidatus Bipolaricaulota bacterium]MDW8109993.1 DNA repair exonuclease [Candidatus Bipolaricaulota bacterium]MDW8328935.1 DNA repair exonuclease [Candidatus Bipolaricaulota bacterium]
MARILHTGDTHIGFRQYGLEERREDFAKAFLQVVHLAIEERVDAVIHAGDLFEDRLPGAEDLQATLQGLFQLKNAHIKFLGIVGNHEQRRGVQWLDLFASLDLAVHLTLQPYDLKGIPIYGLDFAGRRELEPPRCDGGVLVCHQLLDRVEPDGELSLKKLLNCGAKTVLLGDFHERQVWYEKGVLVTYCGSTERWAIDEQRRRSVNLIDLKTNRIDHRDLKTREFLYIGVDEDPIQRLKNADVEEKVVVIYLKGGRVTVAELEELGRQRGALAVRVRDLREGESEMEHQPDVQMDYGDVEHAISEALARRALSPLAREMDQIIRDFRIPDSNIDGEVTALLEGRR